MRGVDARGQEPRLQCQRTDDRFECTCGTEGVTGRTLGRAARHVLAEHAGDREPLGRIVGRGSGTVEIDVVDVAGPEPRRAEANTLALEEQAQEITTAGPASSSARWVNAASEKVLCAPR